ncbi:uncharacterized protein PRCAT00006021001 [Priceomyces carsonii]|uniref:uncharacterized protein n=1 Tax=Priceomyces carsonii TaxID=28549 RepID=UPI002ED7C750|nr:unnamed protein product [Priceomyces carsonii]
MYWRVSRWIFGSYASCDPIDLSRGLIVTDVLTNKADLVGKAVFQQKCYKNAIPMLSSKLSSTFYRFLRPLPIIEESWIKYTHSERGRFAYSVTPIIYSISVLAIISWFFTIFVLTNYTIKASLLLRCSTIFASVFLLLTVVKSGVILHNQNGNGYLNGAELLEDINNSTLLKIFEFISIIFLQISQVQVIMRVFLRQADKRLTLYVGVFASVTSQAIWAVTKFNDFSVNNEADAILPAFIYLVRIAMGICYAALISFHLVTKIHHIMANRRIWLLSLLTCILVYSPVAFFIADIANAWVYELSEFFSVVNYVICVVIPWEWYNKFNLIMRAKEKEGVLGRRFYEDELYELDRYELFVEELDNSSNNEGRVHRVDLEHDCRSSLAQPYSGAVLQLKPDSILLNARKMFLQFTDRIISIGFAIPRSVSSTSPIPFRKYHEQIELDNVQVESRIRNEDINAISSNQPVQDDQEDIRSPITSGSRPRRDVFVYSTKQVTLNFSDDDDTND